MAVTATPVRPPHKKAYKTSRPDDDELPQFAPMPNAQAIPTPYTAAESRHVSSETTAPSASEESFALPPELSFLTQSYAVDEMSIKSQAQINHKVTTLLDHLGSFNFLDVKAKPGLIALHAKAPCANKLISVIEIAKREITAQKGKLYQYTRLGSELNVLKEKLKCKDSLGEGETSMKAGQTLDGKSKSDGTLVEVEVENDDEEPAFETMQSNLLGRQKVRATPTLTVYLSRVPVPELKERFGYEIVNLGEASC
jgi:hypothetical protein